MTDVFDSAGVPHTVSDGVCRPLSGMNRLILMQVMKDHGWKDSRFFTLDQIGKAGGVLRAGAKPVRLEFLFGVDGDGALAQSPVVKNFHVFNASEIEGGLDELPVGTLPSPALIGDVEVALERAGFGVGASGAVLGSALGAWALSLRDDDRAGTAVDVSAQLCSRLATSLTLAELGLSASMGGSAQFAGPWSSLVDADPLSFCEAVNSAQVVAASMVLAVRSVYLERVASEDLARERKAKQSASPRVEALFAERAAILAVPFVEKDAASGLGAVWYGPKSVWFVPNGVAVDAFERWMPKAAALSLGVKASRDVLLESFRESMASLGLDVSGDVIDDGAWHNVPVTTKGDGGRNKSGSYILSLAGGRYGQPIGTIMNKHMGSSLTWTHQGESLTPEQRARARAEAVQRESLVAEQAARARDGAAVHAAEIWAAGVSAEGHGYVLSKGISSEGLRQVSGAVLLDFPEFKGDSGLSAIRPDEHYLLVPMSDKAGALRAVQAISADGSVKSFMRGAQKKGTMAVLGGASFESLLDGSAGPAVGFVEGVATGASFRAVSGFPVVVCFDAGNLETVASSLIPLLPASMSPVLGLDNDQFFVERALGFVAGKVGVNPVSGSGAFASVVSDGVSSLRSVGMGDLVLDGAWHQAPEGKVCASAVMEGGGVRSVSVEVSPAGGRAVSASFSNRGLEVGDAVKSFCAEAAARLVMAVPSFRSLEGRPTDWNDLVQREGVAAARVVLRENLPLGLLKSGVDVARIQPREVSRSLGSVAR